MANKRITTNEVIIERLDTLITLVKGHIQQDDQRFDNLDDILNGNGSPGIKMKLDRIEQTNNRWIWQTRTLWVALLASIGGWLWK